MMPVITETSEKKWNKVDKLEISKLLPVCHLRILIKLWLKILRKDSCDKHRNDLLKRTKGSWYHLTSLPFLCMCSQGGILTLRMRNMWFSIFYLGFPGGSVVKNPYANAGDVDSIPDGEESLEKEMATHLSILAWEIPWTEDPGMLQSMGSQKSQTQLSN